MSSEAKSNCLFLTGVTLALLGLSSLPYLYGYLRQTPALQYLGLHGFAPGDTFVYFSYLWQAYDGHWLFRDFYTTESGGFPIVNTFWAVAGAVGRLLQLPIPLAFHLARIAALAALVAALWRLAGRYLSDVRDRRWATVLAIFGSGVSAYALPWFAPTRELPGYYHLPLDLWVAEFNGFTAALHSGHLVLSLALLALIFTLVPLGVERRQFRWSVGAGLALLGLISFHPFHAPLVLLVVLVWSVTMAWRFWRPDALGHALLIGGLSLPMLAYYVVALWFDPLTAGRAARNLQLTPAWYLLIPSLGLLLPGAIIGLRRLVANQQWRDPRWLLLLVWLAVQTALVVLPVFPFQRRLTTGWTLPLSLLTVYGLPAVRAWLVRRISTRLLTLPGIAAGAFVVLFGMSNLVNLANDLGLMHQRHPLVFRPRNEAAAWVELRRLTDRSAVVLASPATSYLISGIAGRAVVLGHDVETLDYEAKKIIVSRFYQPGDGALRRRMLDQFGVTHVVAGPWEVAGEWSDLETVPFLQEIWRNEVVRIYRVVN